MVCDLPGPKPTPPISLTHRHPGWTIGLEGFFFFFFWRSERGVTKRLFRRSRRPEGLCKNAGHTLVVDHDGEDTVHQCATAEQQGLRRC
eukprot:2553935-Prymnesium_polylepis.2